jgi:hypothetical protein
MKPPPTSVWDLPRNSIEACRAYWMAHDITDEDWRTMLRLQDDPTTLIASAKHWKRPARKA